MLFVVSFALPFNVNPFSVADITVVSVRHFGIAVLEIQCIILPGVKSIGR